MVEARIRTRPVAAQPVARGRVRPAFALPEMAYGRHPVSGEAILVKREENGYWQVAPHVDIDARNKALGLTDAQIAAMMQRATRCKR